MPRFEVGYPRRTGNTEEDIVNLYNFACELSDRLRYTFGLVGGSVASEDSVSIETDTE